MHESRYNLKHCLPGLTMLAKFTKSLKKSDFYSWWGSIVVVRKLLRTTDITSARRGLFIADVEQVCCSVKQYRTTVSILRRVLGHDASHQHASLTWVRKDSVRTCCRQNTGCLEYTPLIACNSTEPKLMVQAIPFSPY